MYTVGNTVKVCVPFGPNVGQVVERGQVVARRYSSIDGWEYSVKGEHGTTWYAAGWVKGA